MPEMVEICCGSGSVSAAFIALGWKCRGYDIVPQPAYPGEFILADLLDLTPADLHGARFAWCSTPCEEFAVHCMKHFHPNPPQPGHGLILFAQASGLCRDAGVPHILENVYCAQRWLGPAANHCGPFYLWGNAVPAIFPADLYKLVKGCSQRTREQAARLGISYASDHRNVSAQKRRRMVASIPPALASYIAQCVTASERSRP